MLYILQKFQTARMLIQLHNISISWWMKRLAPRLFYEHAFSRNFFSFVMLNMRTNDENAFPFMFPYHYFFEKPPCCQRLSPTNHSLLKEEGRLYEYYMNLQKKKSSNLRIFFFSLKNVPYLILWFDEFSHFSRVKYIRDF